MFLYVLIYIIADLDFYSGMHGKIFAKRNFEKNKLK